MPLCLGRLSCYEKSSTALSQATLKKDRLPNFDNHPSWQLTKKRKRSPVQRPVVQQVDRRQGETWKCQLFDFAWTNYQVEFCKFRVRSTVPISYLERYSPKLMSSCRIRHESHTCSDLSYRILMWNASVVQNTSVARDRRVWCGVTGRFLRRHLEE